MAIEVSEYDPAWAAMADAACADLRDALPGTFRAIEHIGSTSVPGLSAKPTIDLMASVTDLRSVTLRELSLGRLGYARIETGMPDRLSYARDRDGRRTHHLHVVPADTWPIRNERLFRDHLLDHPEDVLRYAALKSELAAAGNNPDAYTRGKTALIQELTDRARADRGLPSVPVWEE